MSFSATLIIEDSEYRVTHCDYELRRETDFTGRPASDVTGGDIKLEIESSEDLLFWEHIVMQHQSIDGKIVFKKRDEEAKLKELVFGRAFVVQFRESFDAYGDSPMLIRITLSAQRLSMSSAMGEAELDFGWPE